MKRIFRLTLCVNKEHFSTVGTVTKNTFCYKNQFINALKSVHPHYVINHGNG
jgi:hypothetical protein